MRFLAILSILALANLALADDDYWLRLSTRSQTIAVRPDGTDSRELPHRKVQEKLSPDGKRLMYVEDLGRGDIAIYLADADRKNPKRLKEIDPFLRSLDAIHWSPDSQRFICSADRGDRRPLPQIWAMDRDGSNLQPLTKEAVGAVQPRFAPDGRMSYVAWRKREGKLIMTDLLIADGKETKPLVENQYIPDYAWSPDGKTIAVALVGEMRFYEVASGKFHAIKHAEIHMDLHAHAAHSISWRPDSKAVACMISFLGGRMADPNGNFGKLLGDEEVFIVPMVGKPSYFLPKVGPGSVSWMKELPK